MQEQQLLAASLLSQEWPTLPPTHDQALLLALQQHRPTSPTPLRPHGTAPTAQLPQHDGALPTLVDALSHSRGILPASLFMHPFVQEDALQGSLLQQAPFLPS